MNQASILLASGVDIGHDEHVRALKSGDEIVEQSLCAGEHVRLIGQNQPAARKTLARGLQGERDSCWMMGVIIDDDHIARFSIDFKRPPVAHLETSFDAFIVFQRTQCRVEGDTRGVGSSQGCYSVLYVVDAG